MRHLFVSIALVSSMLLSASIKVNQVGFAPESEKTATIETRRATDAPAAVVIRNAAGEVVWSGKSGETMVSPVSGKPRQVVDFSALTEAGTYTLSAGKEKVNFTIAAHPYAELSRAAIRAFYYQRASMPIEEPYAEGFARVAGHPDNNVMVHPSAASAARPAGTVISSPWGWYDAGDYNKYIVNSAYTVAVMMRAYELNPLYYETLNLNIPESGNGVPDLLDEIWYNIRWMMTMQDADGGVYHKLTTPRFESFIRPDECHQQRYVVKKTTAASLDLAATLAMALRVYVGYEEQFAELYAEGLAMAERAYEWAKANPTVYYDQNAMNKTYSPAVTTGAYDDMNVRDEFFWAATELYILTGDKRYYEDALMHLPKEYSAASWGGVNELAALDWMDRPLLDERLAEQFRTQLIAYLQPYMTEWQKSCYHSPYGNRAEDFFWGSNAEGCCWRGVQLLQAYRLTGDATYHTAAACCLNHLLGQNATGYCYVTRFGTKPTAHPHHRLSYSHPAGTHPGFMAGGPNRHQQDRGSGALYRSSIPDESYSDTQPSYASNEIAINWNATLVALAGWLEALEEVPAYQSMSLSPEVRANDLLRRLTVQEKISLMMDQSPAIERLGIPAFQWWNEALHGVGRNGTSTVFPITMAMAASWNDALLEECFTAVSDEARAKNTLARRSGKLARYQCLSFWTPNINIFRDPRWGRGQETYGEDPYLTGRMGAAVVRGLQGPDNARYRKLLACAKHFAVHSGPEWSRHSLNLDALPERDLWETYLPAFKTLIQDAKVEEVMCAYQRMEGEPCCGNTRYLRRILRDELGFKGLVTSDCWALRDFYAPGCHGVTDTEHQAASMALRAGTDVECGPAFATLPQALEEGLITEDDIDNALRKLLMARIRLGDLDPDAYNPWTKIGAEVVASAEHRDLAYRMAQQTVVLLQNNNHTLPLKKAGQRILVLGPNAADSTMLWGNYNGFPKSTTTILEGIRSKSAEVTYMQAVGYTSSEVKESRFARFVSPDGHAGMRATYYDNTDLQGEPIATAYHTSSLSLSNGGATVFAPGVPLEYFSATYEGCLVADREEDLELYITADDAVRVQINGEYVIYRWDSDEPIMHNRVLRHVKKGDSLHVVIDYRQRSELAMLMVDVTAPASMKQRDILRAAKKADVIVFVGGISPRLEGEEMPVEIDGFRGGDRTHIELPKVQRELIAALAKTGRPVVYVNCSGGALALSPEAANCQAVVQAWYGGEAAGRAMADVLFGDFNPQGKLPVTFYAGSEQLPDFEEYRMQNRTYRYMNDKPLYAFGYGLSYTTFALGEARYENEQVVLDVTNTGTMAGTEVVQVYINRPADAMGPVRTLRAWQRVTLEPGETQHVVIDLPRERFECWSENTGMMQVLPGEYLVEVGTSSRMEDLQILTVTLD